MPSRSANDPERFKGQTRIEGDRVEGGDITDQNCEWCPDPATCSFEFQRRIKGGRGGATWGTGQFIFACDNHREIAKRMAGDPRDSIRKR